MSDIEKIYMEYMPQVYKYLLSICRNEDLAEELTQETFYQAINSIDKFRGDCRLYVWLCQIGKNLWLKHLNKTKKENSVLLTEEIEDINKNLEREMTSKENRLYIHKIIHSLPEDMKEVVYLRLFGEFSFREIGEILMKNENWARVTFYRAKQKIRKEYFYEV